MEEWPAPCEKVLEMFQAGTTLSELIEHVKGCPQCQKVLPFIRREIEKTFGLLEENKNAFGPTG